MDKVEQITEIDPGPTALFQSGNDRSQSGAMTSTMRLPMSWKKLLSALRHLPKKGSTQSCSRCSWQPTTRFTRHSGIRQGQQMLLSTYSISVK